MQPTHSQWLHGKYYTFISARAAAQFSSVVEKLSQFVVCLSITICVGQVAIRRIAYLFKIFVQVKKNGFIAKWVDITGKLRLIKVSSAH